MDLLADQRLAAAIANEIPLHVKAVRHQTAADIRHVVKILRLAEAADREQGLCTAGRQIRLQCCRLLADQFFRQNIFYCLHLSCKFRKDGLKASGRLLGHTTDGIVPLPHGKLRRTVEGQRRVVRVDPRRIFSAFTRCRAK